MSTTLTATEKIDDFLSFIGQAYGPEAKATARRIVHDRFPPSVSGALPADLDLRPVFQEVLRALYPDEVMAADLPFTSH